MITLKVAQPKDARKLGELLFECNKVIAGAMQAADASCDQSLEDCIQSFRQNRCCDVITGWYEAQMVGFCNYGPGRDSDILKDTGEIYHLFIKPEYQRGGDGRRMLHEAIRKLRREEYSQVVVWVGEDNIVAMAFYEALGFKNDGAYRFIDEEEKIKEIRFFRNI